MEKETLKRALIAGSFSVLIIGSLSYLTYGYEYGLFLVASFGSSMVLMLGYPETPFARGRNVFTGHLLTSLAGTICHGLLIVQFDIPIYIVIPLAVGLGIFLMIACNVTHPPAGGNPIIVIIGSASFDYLISPVITGSVIIIIFGVVLNKFVLKKNYPK